MRWQDRLKLLLEKGYFPSELPPPFVTYPFASKAKTFIAAWQSDSSTENCQLERFSFPRVAHARRLLSIPNPIPQLHLSYLIAKEWAQIQRHLRSCDISTFESEFLTAAERALEPINFDKLKAIKTRISAQYGRAVVSDISRFYPSLYTHVIPWALHSKNWCKQNLFRPAFKTSLGNRLDKAVRACQENQSIGLPIGPDTSRILSEVVGVGIDHVLRAHIKKFPGVYSSPKVWGYD